MYILTQWLFDRYFVRAFKPEGESEEQGQVLEAELNESEALDDFVFVKS